MAKEPVPGQVKTRLCPPLTPSKAVRCHEAFLADTLARLKLAGVDPILAVAPSLAGAPRLRAMADARGWRRVEQGAGHLGDRMRAVLETGVREGVSVVIVGSDTPDLPLSLVTAAFVELTRCRVVLGPASDGGYYLVGCRDEVPDIFGAEMSWGMGALWRETLARLIEQGDAPAILPQWHDVDDWEAFRALAARVDMGREHRVNEDDELPVATIRLIDELRRAGFEI